MKALIRRLRHAPRLIRGGLVVAVVAGLAVVLTSTGAAAALVHSLVGGTTPPANDDLAAATVVDPSAVSFDGTTSGASVETGENDAAAGDATVWYRFTPAASGTVLLSASTADPPTPRVYTGDGYPLTRVDSDAAAGAVSFDAVAGTAYLIQVDAAANAGAFDFSLIQPAAGGPANDDLSGAISLNEAVNGLGGSSGSLASGSTSGATTETGEPSGASATVWYSWTVPNDGATLALTVDGGHTLGAFTGTDVAKLNTVTADTAGGVTLSGSSGEVLYVRVGGAGADFTLSGAPSGVTKPDSTPPTVDCTPPSGWTDRVGVPCTAGDDGSGLAHAADASFTLAANVPDGTSSATAATGTRQVCDLAGNCVTAGPVTGLKIDRRPPSVRCAAAAPNWIGAQASVDCSAIDDGSGLADAADASFVLRTTVAPGSATPSAAFGTHADVCDAVGNCAPVPQPNAAKVDLAPPVVHCSAAPAGWHAAETSLECTAADTGSGLADPGRSTFTLSTSVGDGGSDPAAQTASLTVCDQVGNCAGAGPLDGGSVDRAAPVVRCSPPSGWQAGHTASVPCTAADDGSGLADSGDASFDLTASIAAGHQSLTASTGTRKVCDAAGNCATAGPFTVPLDDKPPAITCQDTPAAWQDGAIDVQCTAEDGDGSGVGAADSAFTLRGDVANGTASDAVAIAGRRICDAAGNCAETPDRADGKVDRVTPQVVCDLPGGTHHAEVTVTCTASDVGSGLADPAHATFTLRTSVGAGNHDGSAYTDTRTVCDQSGNCTVAGPVGPFDVDRSSPPPGGPPQLSAPSIVHVLSARPKTAAGVNAGGAGAVPVPFDLPSATASAGLTVRTGCNPEPNGLFPLGRTLVVCAATDDADRTSTLSFPVQVALAPDLAPRTAYRIGGRADARGRGFASGTVARIELDGSVLGAVRAAGNGVVGVAFTVPAGTTPGAHTLVLRGVAPDGQPQLVVAPITLTNDTQPLAVARPTGGTARSSPPGGSTPTPPPVTTTLPPAPPTPHSSSPAPATSGGSGRSTGGRTRGAHPTAGGTSGGDQGVGGRSGGGRSGGGRSGGGRSGGTAPTGAPGTSPGRRAPTGGAASTPPAPQQTFGGGPQHPPAPRARSHSGPGGGAGRLAWLLGGLAVLVVLGGGGLVLVRARARA